MRQYKTKQYNVSRERSTPQEILDRTLCWEGCGVVQTYDVVGRTVISLTNSDGTSSTITGVRFKDATRKTDLTSGQGHCADQGTLLAFRSTGAQQDTNSEDALSRVGQFNNHSIRRFAHRPLARIETAVKQDA